MERLVIHRAFYAPRQPLKTILRGTLEGGDTVNGIKKYWMDNVKEWTFFFFLPVSELLTIASDRKDWRKISLESSLMSPG